MNAIDEKVKIFFEKIDFNFSNDFSVITLEIPDNEKLSKDLENTLYFYKSKNEQTKTSFYLTIRELNKEETFYIKRYIWNKANTEIYFLSENTEIQLLVTDQPNNTNKIATFNYNEKDEEKLQKIHKSEFDRGTFWLNFSNFINKKKKTKRVDKKLIETLKNLQKNLLIEYKDLEEKQRHHISQALIDRTLFIKFLEDNHIINAVFYEKKFQNKELNYKKILASKDKKAINQLFEQINQIFSNHLFKEPFIEDEHLTTNAFESLYKTIDANIKGQLSLFDFDFSAIPIEFIANIYEVFFEENLDEGIFYTPPDLAQLIVDETLKNKIGKVLDPACGSGMFLVVAFRKIVENTQKDFNQLSIEEIIFYKSELLEKYIFGIEKQEYARRLALFALYLEVLNGTNPKDLKEYINRKLRNHEKISLFEKVGKFHENIIYGNSLETEESEKPHNNQRFDFIVGNPPFFKIKSNQNTERKFVEKFEITNKHETLKAKEIIGKYQISQCFMLKVKEWANPETRLGFVLNYSNFTNEKSADFQKFFFTHYQLEKFYEMSEIKKMLFENAMESVGVAIFKNQRINDNKINYLKVEKNSFSDTFKTILIQEENTIQIPQEDILSQKRSLRDYLFANEYDLKLLEKIEEQSNRLEEYLLEHQDYDSFRGMEITGEDAILKEWSMSRKEYSELKNKKKYKNDFLDKYTRTDATKPYEAVCLKPKNILQYQINESFDCFIEKVDNDEKEAFLLKKFARGRNINLYRGYKILANRTGGSLRAVFIKDKIYFDFDVYGIKLEPQKFDFEEEIVYHLFTAILNSDLVNYFLKMKELKRTGSSFPKNNVSSIKNIPIPKNLEEDIVAEIADLSQKLSEGKLKYEGDVKKEINELVGDLYKLDFLETTRIREFLEKPDRKLTEKEIQQIYCETLQDSLRLYTEPKIQVYVGKNLPFNLVCVGVYYDTENYPNTKRTLQEIINDLIKDNNNPYQVFYPIQRMYFTKKVIYIIKENKLKNWSETKAFEDAQQILKKSLKR